MSLNGIVPLPNHIEPTVAGPFVATDETTVSVAGAKQDSLESVVAGIIRLPSSPKGGQIAIRVDKDAQLPPSDEAYRIEVTPDGIQVLARTDAGAVRASATIAQMLQVDKDGNVVVPSVIVEDAPRFGWRGLSMDVARSFYPVSELKSLIDLMVFYRMNTLHLHLTDDQGWRFTVPSRPLLTEVSGATASTAAADARAGYYTPREFAELVDYATARHVTVIPELDVPGHTNAATHAYGELMPDGKPTGAYGGAKVGFSRLYADLPSTTPFLNDIFTAAAHSTPSPYLHIGGDEAEELGLAEYNALVETAADVVSAAGKTVVGWQEIASASLPSNAVVQYWQTRIDPTPVVNAAQRGNPVLMSPAPHAYLDMQYGKGDTELGQDWAGFIELEDAYQWDPATILDGVPAESVVGVEAGMWTERIPLFDDLMYMLLPRLPALAEVSWTGQDRRDWDDFTNRIANHPDYWEAADLSWHRSPGVDWTI